jgi:hypothetical protein
MPGGIVARHHNHYDMPTEHRGGAGFSDITLCRVILLAKEQKVYIMFSAVAKVWPWPAFRYDRIAVDF